MHHVFQAFVNRLSEGVDEVAFNTAMSQAAAAFDLSCFAYLCLPHQKAGEARLISTYPVAWTRHYLEKHYERLDPVIRQALRDTEPFEWGSKIEHGEISKAQRQLLDEASMFGIRYGFTIPIHDGRGPVAAVTFASAERSQKFRHCIQSNRRVLQLMALYFHANARRKLQGIRAIGSVTLSPREYECLDWSAAGKSAWEIGQILAISRRTVVFILRMLDRN